MSLNFDVSKIENYDENFPETDDGNWNWITYAVVHRMMHTGTGPVLRQDNAAEFYARCIICDKMGGELIFIDEKPYSLTPDDIQKHIGLKVNVAQESRSQFLKRYMEYEFDKLFRAYSKEVTVDAGQNP